MGLMHVAAVIARGALGLRGDAVRNARQSVRANARAREHRVQVDADVREINQKELARR